MISVSGQCLWTSQYTESILAMSEQLLCFNNKELIGYEVYICTQCFIFFYFIFFYHQIVAFHSIFNNNAFSIKEKIP